MTDTPIAAIRARLNFHTQDEFIRAFAPLVSAGGMFLRTRQIKPVGSTVRFDFSLANGQRLLFGEGVVKQIKQPTADAPNAPSGMLLKFTKLNRASKALIQQIIAYKRASAITTGAPAAVAPPPAPAGPPPSAQAEGGFADPSEPPDRASAHQARPSDRPRTRPSIIKPPPEAMRPPDEQEPSTAFAHQETRPAVDPLPSGAMEGPPASERRRSSRSSNNPFFKRRTERAAAQHEDDIALGLGDEGAAEDAGFQERSARTRPFDAQLAEALFSDADPVPQSEPARPLPEPSIQGEDVYSEDYDERRFAEEEGLAVSPDAPSSGPIPGQEIHQTPRLGSRVEPTLSGAFKTAARGPASAEAGDVDTTADTASSLMGPEAHGDERRERARNTLGQLKAFTEPQDEASGLGRPEDRQTFEKPRPLVPTAEAPVQEFPEASAAPPTVETPKSALADVGSAPAASLGRELGFAMEEDEIDDVLSNLFGGGSGDDFGLEVFEGSNASRGALDVLFENTANLPEPDSFAPPSAPVVGAHHAEPPPAQVAAPPEPMPMAPQEEEDPLESEFRAVQAEFEARDHRLAADHDPAPAQEGAFAFVDEEEDTDAGVFGDPTSSAQTPNREDIYHSNSAMDVFGEGPVVAEHTPERHDDFGTHAAADIFGDEPQTASPQHRASDAGEMLDGPGGDAYGASPAADMFGDEPAAAAQGFAGAEPRLAGAAAVSEDDFYGAGAAVDVFGDDEPAPPVEADAQKPLGYGQEEESYRAGADVDVDMFGDEPAAAAQGFAGAAPGPEAAAAVSEDDFYGAGAAVDVFGDDAPAAPAEAVGGLPFGDGPDAGQPFPSREPVAATPEEDDFYGGAADVFGDEPVDAQEEEIYRASAAVDMFGDEPTDGQGFVGAEPGLAGAAAVSEDDFYGAGAAVDVFGDDAPAAPVEAGMGADGAGQAADAGIDLFPRSAAAAPPSEDDFDIDLGEFADPEPEHQPEPGDGAWLSASLHADGLSGNAPGMAEQEAEEIRAMYVERDLNEPKPDAPPTRAKMGGASKSDGVLARINLRRASREELERDNAAAGIEVSLGGGGIPSEPQPQQPEQVGSRLSLHLPALTPPGSPRATSSEAGQGPAAMWMVSEADDLSLDSRSEEEAKRPKPSAELGSLLDELQGGSGPTSDLSGPVELRLASNSLDEGEAFMADPEDPSLESLLGAAQKGIKEQKPKNDGDADLLDSVLGGDLPEPPTENPFAVTPAENPALSSPGKKKKKRGFFSRLFGSND